MKALKNTAWQFETEFKETLHEIEETEAKLKETRRRTKVSKQRVSRLNIELGELKLLLEEIIAEADNAGKGTAMGEMMKNLGDGGDEEWAADSKTWDQGGAI